MAANQRARPKPKRRAESKRPVRRSGPRQEARVSRGPSHHSQASSALYGELADIAPEGDVAIIYGNECQAHTRIFPLLAAETFDDEDVWRPSRLC